MRERPVVPEPVSAGRVRFGVFEVDLRSQELRKYGVPIRLANQPFRVLELLLKASGEVVTREELRLEIWGTNVFVDYEHSLNKAVNRLREVLGDSADNPRFIETISKRGYKFIAPVQFDQDVHPNSTQTTEANVPALPRAMFLRPIFLFAVVAVVLATSAYFAFRSDRETRTIAVLPFENLKPEGQDDYLAEGLTDSVIHSLSEYPEMRVVSRNSTYRFKGRNVDASVAARELGVDEVVVGRVSRLDDKLTVSVELVDPSDNHTVWGRSFVRTMDGLAGIEQEIAREAVRESRGRLNRAERQVAEKVTTRDSIAFQLYLQGLYNLNKINEQGLLEAISFFERAVERDRSYALAWAGLAFGYNKLPYLGTYSPSEAAKKAKAAAETAIALDPNLAEAHTALASVYEDFDGNLVQAEREYKLAIRLNPSFATARHWYSHLLSRTGRHEEAIAEAKRAVIADPLSPPVNTNLAAAYVFAGDNDAAIERCQLAIKLDPQFQDAHYVLGIAYREKGMYQQAIDEFRDHMARQPDDKYAFGFLAYAYAIKGDRAAAEGIIAKLKSEKTVTPFAIAVALNGLGRTDEVFEWLRQAMARNDPYLRYLKVEPALKNLRGDPRFVGMLRQLNLT